MNSLDYRLECAELLLSKGFSLIPLHARGKRPLWADWTKKGIRDAETFRACLAQHPDCNIGVVTGASSGLYVLDIDPKNGGDKTLADLEARFGKLPDTFSIKTGGGGAHYYFRLPGGEARPGTVQKIGPGVDTRAEGGQVVAPGSIHESGRTYEIASDAELADAPKWLLDQEDRGRVSRTADTPFAAGSRNNDLCSVAGTLRRKGAEPHQIEAALQALNNTFKEPLPADEVYALAYGMGRYSPSVADEFSDRALADRFAGMNRDKLVHTPQQGWLCYANGRWQMDLRGLQTQECVKQFVALIEIENNRRAAEIEAADAKRLLTLSKKCQSATVIRNIEKLAASNENVLRSMADIDALPNFLNIQNGVIDLRNGEMIAHDPALLMTKQANVRHDPTAECPHFDRFLNEVLGPEKGKFLLRALAYSLLDSGKEQLLFMLCGAGRNGKTTLVNVFHHIFGSYVTVMDPSTLLRKQQSGIPNDLARLKGVRTVFTSELPQGAVLDAALLKRLVGNETITARFLHQEYFEFEPRGVMFLTSNHVPVIDGSDFALARRMCLIKFEHVIPDDRVDPHLQSKLLEESAGIFNRVLAELASYRKHGLQIPTDVETATRDYITESDVIEQFFSALCVMGPGRKIGAADLHGAYLQYCVTGGLKALSKPTFKRALEAKGLRQHREAKGSSWLGVDLLARIPQTLSSCGAPAM